MTRFNKILVMLMTLTGALVMISGVIGLGRRWWSDGIDPEFLLTAVLAYCVVVILEHVFGKGQNND
jgi:hypothetical protein